ncbi:MAG: divalent-cation tolerance protein CutA [Planctomycetales bacterium]|nr:divalent-cation tolerance protein CutA [Planctomycetales bacterium]
MSDYCVVLTTFGDEANGEQIIDALISQRLAACIQVMPIQSYYRWDGKVNCDAEKLVVIKTTKALYEKVQDTITANHAYETPQVVQVPITDGLPAYLDWISDETQ